MSAILAVACLMFPIHAFAECTTTVTGRTECSNGQAAHGYNLIAARPGRRRRIKPVLRRLRQAMVENRNQRIEKRYIPVQLGNPASEPRRIRAALKFFT
jgi:hypothetical protein